MKKYLVKIKPLEPYAFGTERNFTYEGIENAGKETYFIKTNRMPEQTTILGMLRYIILDNKGLINSNFKYDEEKRQKIAELIGENSFSFSSTEEQSFGCIDSFSPVFILDEHDNILINTPYHVKNDNNICNAEYKTLKMSEKVYETSEGLINIPEEGEFSAKLGHSSGYFNLTKNCILKEDSNNPLFRVSVQTGNRKNEKHDNSDKDCFFKREVISMNEKYCFGVFVEAEELPSETIAYLGQKKSAFKITAVEDKENNIVSKLHEEFNSDEIWYYALSDIVIEGEVKYKNFCIVEEKQLRNLETNYSANDRKNSLKKSSVQYNLISRGSVFYKELPEWKLDDNKKKVGYNIVVQIGGKRNDNKGI